MCIPIINSSAQSYSYFNGCCYTASLYESRKYPSLSGRSSHTIPSPNTNPMECLKEFSTHLLLKSDHVCCTAHSRSPPTVGASVKCSLQLIIQTQDLPHSNRSPGCGWEIASKHVVATRKDEWILTRRGFSSGKKRQWVSSAHPDSDLSQAGFALFLPVWISNLT
jgi:hypothetical protein